MIENVRVNDALTHSFSSVIALVTCLVAKKEIAMTHTRYAFIKANWHSHIVDKALEGFCSVIPIDQVDVFDVPGAFEMPLVADDLADTGKYSAIAAAALVVDGGIYRHEFVAQSVVEALMQVSLSKKIPVLSVSLTPHQYQETDHHNEIYQKHFIEKGREAARAALMVVETRSSIAK
jgi:6,7-dimethyl-8-ribityllumazine synthase